MSAKAMSSPYWLGVVCFKNITTPRRLPARAGYTRLYPPYLRGEESASLLITKKKNEQFRDVLGS